MKDPRKTLEAIRYWWDKAEECLESAQREFEAHSYEFAMNRIYYAVFYGVPVRPEKPRFLKRITRKFVATIYQKPPRF
jgi:hypothetical protein